MSLFSAADKYTRVLTDEREWVIRTTLEESEAELDPDQLWGVRRGTPARAGAIESARHDLMGRVRLSVKGMNTPVAVDRAYAHRFWRR